MFGTSDIQTKNFFRLEMFYGCGRVLPSAFVNSYALPISTFVTMYGPSQLGSNFPAGLRVLALCRTMSHFSNFLICTVLL